MERDGIEAIAYLSEDERLAIGGKTQAHYESIIKLLASVRAKKIRQYGEERYEETDPNWAMLMVYSDINRKTLRLRRLCELAASDEDSAAVLRENLLDLANYAIMGVQEIERLKLCSNK